MTPEQFARLLDLLEKMSNQRYSITDASDWNMLAWIGGFLAAVIAAMWIDLRGTIKDNRSEWRDELERHKADSKGEIQIVWDAIHDCQNDCCPRAKK